MQTTVSPQARGRFPAILLFPVLLGSACAPSADPPDLPDAEVADLPTGWEAAVARVLPLEDTRPDASERAPLLALLLDVDPAIRGAAARALGRLEDPALAETLLPLLGDVAPLVRAQAANAIAQSLREQGSPAATRALLRSLPSEADAEARAAQVRSLGRMAVAPEERADVAGALASSATGPRDSTSLPVLLAVTRAHESMVRGGWRETGLGSDAVALLRELAALGGEGLLRARIRGSALRALLAANAADSATVGRALTDEDWQVRRIAVLALGAAASATPTGAEIEPEVARAALRAALDDPAPQVRSEAVRTVRRVGPQANACRLAVGMVDDADILVALAAIDALEGCREADSVLVRILQDTGNAGPDWHRHAHAALTLARNASPRAGSFVRALAESTSPFARAYAMRAALPLADTMMVRLGGTDANANVRTAAIESLFALIGHDSDLVLLEQLDRQDAQLAMRAADLLEGSPAPRASARLLDALDRATERRRETSRDLRVALLRRISELGEAPLSPRLAAYTSDFDPVVATLAAEILAKWGETPDVEVQARALPAAALPDADSIAALAHTRVVLEMSSGDEIEISLLAALAPTNAARFARLAAEGYFDGLTFHRVVSNFVIQGGSPGANEFVGDGPFSRDELGLMSNWRGTVGLSTRGRDTGDAQIYVNLIDNMRLDHEYTVFGRVTRGLEVVDRILEGDVIARARVQRGPPLSRDR